MKRYRKTYSYCQLFSAAFMMVALFWLTVSTPFVYAGQQKMLEKDKMTNSVSSSAEANDEESTNPFGNSTEEKSSNSNSSFSEEYLHDHPVNEYFFTVISHYPKCQDAGTYIAFHGELLVPPPNQA